MQGERQPAVAGAFYPADRPALEHQLAELLREAGEAPASPLKALIVPHAGYMYSGVTAAIAYARLRALRGQVRRVVLLGPSHQVPFPGLAVPSVEAFATPLGSVPLDREGIETALAQPGVQTLDAAHAREHSLETQLPFLQWVLGDFSLVPLVVGSADPDTVAGVLEALWDGPETLVVISSDLSHFHDDATARELDQATARAIETLDPEAIGHDNACGFQPVNGLLRLAERRGDRLTTLDLRNSGDAGAPRERVVGYGAFALEERRETA